jgi:hypothetical protein
MAIRLRKIVRSPIDVVFLMVDNLAKTVGVRRSGRDLGRNPVDSRAGPDTNTSAPGNRLPRVALLAVLLAGCGSAPIQSSDVGSPSMQPTFTASASGSSPSAAAVPRSDPLCPVTTFETIPQNDIVGWDQRSWQRAAVGVWAHPYLNDFTNTSGFPASDTDIKVLWWVLDGGNDTLVLNVTSLPPGGYGASYSFDPPGVDRRDRPTGFATPPPGCYEVRVTVGTRSGVVIDQVLP